jgi:hypothetical protein
MAHGLFHQFPQLPSLSHQSPKSLSHELHCVIVVILSLASPNNVCEALVQEFKWGQVPVALACDPSYSRGRDQEDHGSKPAPSK